MLLANTCVGLESQGENNPKKAEEFLLMSDTAKCWALFPIFALLAACAAQPQLPPMALNDESFYSLIAAGRMELAEATLWVSLAECGDIGTIAVESDRNLSPEFAMSNAAQKIDTQLKSMGSNTYAVQSMQWLSSGQLSLEIKTLICSD